MIPHRYVPSITLIDDVFRSQKHLLIVTTFASFVLWIIFATLLYLTESNNHNTVNPGELDMAQRFSNVPNSLQVTIYKLPLL